MSPRAVIVTGGAAGIGWATARRFAAAGDRVLIADIDGARAQARAEELGAAHRAVRSDLTRREDVAAMIGAGLSAFGRLDVLVNNAGRIDSSGTAIVDQPTEAFLGLFALNLDGALAAAEEAARVMAAHGGGVIVNVASGAALRAIPLRNAYSASKAALVTATRNLACRFAPLGIQVSAIAPGYTRTELVDTLIQNGRVDPTKAVQRIPLGRMGTPDEIAAGVFHLASPAARPFVGGLLLVDGGGQAYGGSDDAGIQRGAPPTTPPPGQPVVLSSCSNDRLAAALAQQCGRRGARLLRLGADIDLSDRAAVHGRVEQLVNQFGRIDALVTVTAGLVASDARDDLTPRFEDEMRRVLHLAQAAGRQMLQQGFGAVCAVTSIRGQIGLAMSDNGADADSAVAMFTRSMACEWGGSGIRANTLAVGPLGSDDPLVARMPLRRALTVDEVAANVDFLISPEASYLTGTVMCLDGGLSHYGGPDL